MRKILVDNSCKECGHTESHTVLICDTCGTQLGQNGYIIKEVGSLFPLELTMGGTDYIFCDFKCILKFIIDELTKEK
jgi:hypothetical protein